MKKNRNLSLTQRIASVFPLAVKIKIRSLLGLKFLYKSKFYPIKYQLFNQQVEFFFCAPKKFGLKAQKIGIENTIIRRVYEYCQAKPSGIVVDVGMNFGFLSMVWAKSMPQHQLVSFEVHPGILQNAKDAQKKSNISNITVVGLPVFNKIGEELDVYLGVYSGSSFEDEFKKITLSSTTLDHYFSTNSAPILAIKIDTDHVDYEVLQGAQEIIKKNRPMLVVEVNNHPKIIPFLFNCGYSVYDMEGQEIISNQIDLKNSRYMNVFGYPEKLPTGV